MIEVLKAARELQEFCESQGWRSCFIGGLAQLRWGEPRETIDADLTLLTGYGQELSFVESLLQQFAGRIPDAAAFAVQHRVVLMRSRAGVGLDVSLGGLPYEERVVEHSSVFVFRPSVSLRTCSADDLVVLKAFAARSQDWADIERLIVRQAGKLDWDYILRQLQPFAELKAESDILEQLARRRREFEG